MDNPGEILRLCRLCLVKDQVNIPIFEEQGDIRQIFLKISSCLPVKVSRDDQLPKRICDGCSNKLDLLYEFWNTSANAEKTLLSWLGQAGIKDADETITAVAHQIAKPTEAEVKEEDEPLDDGHIASQATDSFEAQSLEEGTKDEAEAPPPKRARRTAAVKAQINITPESDDDDDMDSAEPMTKMEDESDESDGEDKDPSYTEVPGTSADDQAGPSGVGKDGAEAPLYIAASMSTCYWCKKSFDSEYQIKRHYMALVIRVSNSCGKCGKFCSQTKKMPECFHRSLDQCPYCNICKSQFDDTFHKAEGTNDGFLQFKENLCVDRDNFEDQFEGFSGAVPHGAQYVCFKCGKIFSEDKYSNFLDHEARHFDRGSSISCNICGRSFHKLWRLKRHFKSLNIQLQHCCQICQMFIDAARSETNEKTMPCGHKVEADALFCKFCREKVDKGLTQYHVCFHPKVKKKVKNCNNSKPRQVYQKRGWPPPPYVCSYCNKEYGKYGYLQLVKHEERHRRITLQTNIIQCKKCNLVFETEKEKASHKYRFHKRVPLSICDICGFATKHIARHRAVHLNDRPFQCDLCPKTFRANYGLKKHMLIHSNEAKYQCKICGKSFKFSYNLTVHTRIHEDIKPFECSICNKTFTTKQWRDKHAHTHC